MAEIAMKKQRQQQLYGNGNNNSYVSSTPAPAILQDLNQRSLKDQAAYGSSTNNGQVNTQSSTQAISTGAGHVVSAAPSQ